MTIIKITLQSTSHDPEVCSRYLRKADCVLVRANLDKPLSHDTCLSNGEHQHADHLVNPIDRDRYKTVRCLVRSLIARLIRQPAHGVEFRTGEFGKPYLEGGDELEFNISHSRQHFIAAFTLSGRIGVDIEALENDSDTADIVEAWPAMEQEIIQTSQVPAQSFLSGWTAREAILKAYGLGLGHIEGVTGLDLRTADGGLKSRVMTPWGEVELAAVNESDVLAGALCLIRERSTTGSTE